MNDKENILDAWIVVEKLAEGSIDPKEQRMMTFDSQVNDWKKKFQDFLVKNKEQEKVSDEEFRKSGIALFFGIFDFNEVVEILRNKYNIPMSYGERSNSKKFTVAVFFDNKLQFRGNKFFYTMSGYIRDYGDFPANIEKEESEFCDEIRGKLSQESFQSALLWLFCKYEVDHHNFRYKFVRDLEWDDVNMHSFFIRDLEKAKRIDTDNLNRYFTGNLKERINLNSKKDSVNFNPEIFEDILQPKFYPEGRFPSNSDYALSFMQQAATNIAINVLENIRSVNGPPGTGKTTLLKDIFSHMIVCQAVAICQLSDKCIQGELNYWEHAKIGILPNSIAEKNIVVASSNNGAVQNIVRELPQKENISPEFLEELMDVDYFKEISNSKITGEGIGKGRTLKRKKGKEKYWGAFSMEGGASTNVNKLLLIIEAIEQELEENYKSDEGIYEEFICQYDKVSALKREMQGYCEQLKELHRAKNQYKKEKVCFEQERRGRQSSLDSILKEKNEELKKCEQENSRIRELLVQNASNLNIVNESLKQAERNYDTIQLQKPVLLWLQKLINRSRVKEYFNNLNHVNDILDDLMNQKIELSESQSDYKEAMAENDKKISDLRQNQYDKNIQFTQWREKKINYFQKLKEKIERLEKIEALYTVNGIDFSQPYDELQKSNPWFDKQFRIMQTELFIAALKVKKQFLYDNRKNLGKARMIWIKQSGYVSKENGDQIIAVA